MSRLQSRTVRKLEATKAKRATKRELIVVATMISRMIGTSLFSDRTEFSVNTGVVPKHSRAALNLILEPGLYVLLRFQNPAVRENWATGNQAFSMRLRFLTIRVHLRERKEFPCLNNANPTRIPAITKSANKPRPDRKTRVIKSANLVPLFR